VAEVRERGRNERDDQDPPPPVGLIPPPEVGLEEAPEAKPTTRSERNPLFQGRSAWARSATTLAPRTIAIPARTYAIAGLLDPHAV
jgi:hypothetical protein